MQKFGSQYSDISISTSASVIALQESALAQVMGGIRIYRLGDGGLGFPGGPLYFSDGSVLTRKEYQALEYQALKDLTSR